MLPLIIPFLVLILFFVIWNIRSKQQWKSPSENFPENWKRILEKFVAFYNALSPDEKVAFEYKIQEFLLNCRITGISTTIDDTDRVLVASSAIIPIFQFKEWRYNNIAEVLIYPDTLNQNFDTEGHGRQILGMVGTGYMNGKMILQMKPIRKIQLFMSLFILLTKWTVLLMVFLRSFYKNNILFHGWIS